ncbi:hypothetical protein GCM10028784_22640 [Myceligenerans cantabricum]
MPEPTAETQDAARGSTDAASLITALLLAAAGLCLLPSGLFTQAYYDDSWDVAAAVLLAGLAVLGVGDLLGIAGLRLLAALNLLRVAGFGLAAVLTVAAVLPGRRRAAEPVPA